MEEELQQLKSKCENITEEKMELRNLLGAQAEDRQVVEEEKRLLQEKLDQVSLIYRHGLLYWVIWVRRQGCLGGQFQ